MTPIAHRVRKLPSGSWHYLDVASADQAGQATGAVVERVYGEADVTTALTLLEHCAEILEHLNDKHARRREIAQAIAEVRAFIGKP